MDRVKVSKYIWDDYIVIGMAVSILLTMLGFSDYGVYQIVPIAVIMVITGMMENLKIIGAFVKNNWLLCAIVIGVILYYVFISKTPDMGKLVTSSFAMVLSGFCLAFSCKGKCKNALIKTGVFVFAVILVDVSKILNGSQQGLLFRTITMSEMGLLSCFEQWRSLAFLALTGLGIVIGRFEFLKNERKN